MKNVRIAYAMQAKIICVLSAIIFLCSSVTNAQLRKMGFVFSENLKGNALSFGNTLMYYAKADSTVDTVAMNGNSIDGNSLYDNGNFGTTNMQYVDIDSDTSTRNSSSANLILPAGTNTILLARLYWGGRALSSEFDMADPVNQKIKIKKDTSAAYTEYAAAQIDRAVVDFGLATEFCRYQAFADITNLVKQQGQGTYTVGNGAFSSGTGGDFGNYGAWSIVVVYANPLESFNSVRVIDGFQEVYSGGGSTTNSITVTGLNVPAAGLLHQEAKIGVIAWEGDARYNGDFFKVNDTILTNSLNPENNNWNGTVTIDGVHVTTKNPSYTDQMGIDIDEFYVGTGYGIQPNASSVFLQFGTNQDQYFCGVITAVIKMKEPDVKINKFVADSNNNQIAELGEILTYTIKGKNFGSSNVSSVVITDSLAATMLFVPNSLELIHCNGFVAGPLTDSTGDDIAEYIDSANTIIYRLGNGADSVNGGILAATDSFEVSFKVRFNPIANGTAPPVINAARLRAKSAIQEDVVDDATVTISGSTAQRIVYTFTGNGNWDNPLNWRSRRIPPATLPVFSTIVIDPIITGECILNVQQNIATGASVIVKAGKNLVLTGSLTIQ